MSSFHLFVLQIIVTLMNFQSGRTRKKVDYAMSDSADDGSEEDVENSQNTKAESRASSADLVADNAVTSPGKINTSEIVDQVSPREGFQGGGGICADDKIAPEISVLQSSSSKNDDILVVTQPPNDHLTMGGGFCLDENDPYMNSGGLASPTKATTPNSDLPNQSSSFDDRNCPSNPRQSSNNPTEITDRGQQVESQGRVDPCHINNTGCTDIIGGSLDDNGAANEPIRSLRAMPNLRKKRRKS